VNKTPLVTPYVSFEIKDDILYVTYFSGNIITIDITKEIVKQRLEYINGKSYPLLVVFEGITAMDKRSRDYSSKEGSEGVLAGALLTNSVYAEFFGNFFLRLTKPEIPARLFTDKQEALKWLEQFKLKY
jgi:hypothetical protein